MPVKRLCCFPSCPNFREENSSYCKKHSYLQEERDRRREEESRKYFENRQKVSCEFYNTSRWRTERKRFLAMHQYCQICEGLATEIHHDYQTKEYLNNEEMFFDEDRWVPLCHKCHTRISNRKANIRTGKEKE